MGFVLRLLSPLMFSLVRRYGPRWPGLEPERIARGKRRLGAALLLGTVSLVLLTTSLLLTMVDLAVQYEQRGDFTWNAILWLCVGLFVTGLASAAGAKTTMPGVRDFVPFKEKAKARPGGVAKVSGDTVRPPRRPEYAH